MYSRMADQLEDEARALLAEQDAGESTRELGKACAGDGRLRSRVESCGSDLEEAVTVHRKMTEGIRELLARFEDVQRTGIESAKHAASMTDAMKMYERMCNGERVFAVSAEAAKVGEFMEQLNRQPRHCA